MQANELFDRPNTILLDGGMGTMLQAAGLKLGARPEELNITDPALIEGIHGQYAAAGSRIVNANTFGASAHKLAGSAYTLEQVITAGIENCKRACAPYGALTALDVGPLGELLEPSGTLAFEDAVSEYARIVRAGAAAGAGHSSFIRSLRLWGIAAAGGQHQQQRTGEQKGGQSCQFFHKGHPPFFVVAWCCFLPYHKYSRRRSPPASAIRCKITPIHAGREKYFPLFWAKCAKKPSQSPAVTAPPKGELFGIFRQVEQNLPLSGEVASRSDDGEGFIKQERNKLP